MAKKFSDNTFKDDSVCNTLTHIVH